MDSPFWNANKPQSDKFNKVACVPREDSGQPGHQPNRIIVLAERSIPIAETVIGVGGCPG